MSLTSARKIVGVSGLAACAVLMSGCATYYEDLMSNQQLMAASCEELAEEQRKISSNIDAHREGANIGLFGALSMVALEGAAGTGNSGSMALAEGGDNDARTARELQEKNSLVGQLRAKRGCY